MRIEVWYSKQSFQLSLVPPKNFTDQPSLSDPCPNHHHNVLVRPSWHMKGLSYYDRGYSQQCTLLSYRATTCTLQWGRWYRDIYTNAPKQKDPIKKVPPPHCCCGCGEDNLSALWDTSTICHQYLLPCLFLHLRLIYYETLKYCNHDALILISHQTAALRTH